MTDPTKPKPKVAPGDSTSVGAASHNPYEDSSNPYESANPYEAPVAPAQTLGDKLKSALSGALDYGESGLRGFGQGATMGWGDELAGTLGEGVRDRERAANKAAHDKHPWVYNLSEVLGGALPIVAGGGVPGTFLKAAAASAGYGALSGLGHASGSAGEQAAETGIGAVAGGVLGMVPGTLGAAGRGLKTIGSRLADKADPGRVVTRALSREVSPEMLAALQEGNTQAPGSTALADVLPNGEAWAKDVGHSAYADQTARAGAHSKLDLREAYRQNVGNDFNIVRDNEIALTPEVQNLMTQLGIPPEASWQTIKLGKLQDMLSSIRSGIRTMPDGTTVRSGTPRYLRQQLEGELKNEIDTQLPGYKDLLSQYWDARQRSDVSRSLAEALDEAGTRHSVNLAGGSEGGLGGVAGVSSHGNLFARISNKMFDPSQSQLAEQVQQQVFDPNNAESALQRALTQKGSITPSTPPQSPSVAGGMLAQAPGQMFAMPAPLSSNATEAKQLGTQAMLSGMPRDSLRMQLSQRYTPATVEFVLAALPNRLPQ